MENITLQKEILSCLGPVQTVGRSVLCLKEAASTNDVLKEAARQGGADGTVVTADIQTAGRGRRGRTFCSPQGGLYLSVLLRPNLPVQALQPVTAMTGVAVCQAVETSCGLRPGLKWPNDLVIVGKKAGGILVELIPLPEGPPALIIGIGINLRRRGEGSLGEAETIAAFLEEEAGRMADRGALAAALIGELDRMYSALKAGDTGPYLARYRRDCVTVGREVLLMDTHGQRRARAIGVGEDFGLMVEFPGGEQETIRTGEVSVRGLFGYGT